MITALFRKGRANFRTDTTYICQVQVTVRLARSADADKGNFGIKYRLTRITGSSQVTGLHGVSYHCLDLVLHDRGLTSIDQINLGGVRVDSDDLMPCFRETSGRNNAHVTEAKDTDSH